MRVHVENYHLVVRDGAGTERQERRFHRAYSGRANGGIRRLIVIGHSGNVSLGALRWLRQAGAAFVNVDPYSGESIAISAPSATMIPQLRRAQAQALTTTAGVEVARYLISEKVSGQSGLLGELPGGAGVVPALQQVLRRLKSAGTVAELVKLEA